MPTNSSTRIRLRALPGALRRQIESSLGFRGALANTGWLFGDKILRMGLGLIVFSTMARYLGPERFGMLSYALAFVSLFAPIANLGLPGIVVRDLVTHPESARSTLGSAFFLHVVGGSIAFGSAALVIGFVRPQDPALKLMVIIAGAAMVFKAADVVKYWFESQVQSKYTVWVENAIFIVFAGVTLMLILMQASLLAFVWAIFAEAGLVSFALLGIYRWKRGSLIIWRNFGPRARELLRDSWPLVVAGLAVITYMRIDQIMIGQMLGDQAVGIYSAAVRISEVWYFVPIAIVASTFPAITRAKQAAMSYQQQLQRLYHLLVSIALIVAVAMLFFADWIAVFLFGSAYQATGPILAVHVWAGVFVSLGVASSKWLLLENFQHHILYRALLGMTCNIALNFLLIPVWGGMGAAIATLISYAISIFSIYLSEDTRIGAVMMWRALHTAGLGRADVGI